MKADERRCSDSRPRIFTDDRDESPLLCSWAIMA
jgi:hypothetical protein